MSETPPESSVSLPSDALLASCLEVLGGYVGEPGTMALHDPIYLARRDGSVEHLQKLLAAFEMHPRHPAVPQLRKILELHLPHTVRSLSTVLAEDSPIGDGADLLDIVDQRLRDARRVRTLLEERVEELEYRVRKNARTANLLAAVGALVAIIALIGWLIALGALSISWFESPAVEFESVEDSQD